MAIDEGRADMDRNGSAGGTRRRIRPTGWALATSALLVLGGVACDNPLDVENPNKLVEEDLVTPVGLTSFVNGALGSVSEAVSLNISPNATVADELTWIGSRDAWGQLTEGSVDDPTNEFIDAAFAGGAFSQLNESLPSGGIAEARWLTDEALKTAQQFDSEGTILRRRDLARAYLYAAIAYITAADFWDDFTLSDRMEAAAPVGAANMNQLYQTAIGYLDSGIQVAQALGETEMVTRMYAVRARAKHALQIWGLLNPPGSTPADPLVSDAGASADAQTVLDRIGDPDWRYQFTYSFESVWSGVGWQVNERSELQIDSLVYATWDAGDPTDVTGVRIRDPIDDIPDPAVSAHLNVFLASQQFPALTVVSAREMHLILAEAALAGGDMGGFTTHINHVRALDGTTPYSGQIPAEDMLIYQRQSSLFLQGRRLNDMYRFGITSGEWNANSTAMTRPGTLFPIPLIERESNPNVP